VDWAEFHFQPKHMPLNARLADGVVIAAIELGLDRIELLADALKSGRKAYNSKVGA
jgi:hypothetical protein